MSRRVRSLAAALTVTCAVVMMATAGGCSSKEEGRFYDDKDGFSIRFPENWETMENFMGMRVAARSPRATPDDLFQENVNVVVERAGNMTLEQYDSVCTANVEKILTDYRLIETGRATLGGEPGKRVVMTHRMGQFRIKASSHFTLKDGRAYAVTCSALEETYDRFQPQFDEIVKTFRFE